MTAKTKPETQNGQPETFTLELRGEELNLLHQCLTQLSFPQADAKMVAAATQVKIEALVQTVEA